MRNHPKTSVIIVNYNGLQDTIECLDSLKNISYPNYELIVVDNGSDHNDAEALERKYGNDMAIIRNEKNIGFAGANNIGIRHSAKTNPKYTLFLNNDIVVQQQFLDFLVEAGEANPEVGILTPKIHYYGEPNKIWMAGGYISRIRASGFPVGEGKDDHHFDQNRLITFSSGCCMLVKNEVIEKIGLWDENYFLYLEDTDFCQRALDAGFKILYVAKGKIYHKVHAACRRIEALLPLYYVTRNRLYFAKQSFGLQFYPAFICVLLATIVKSILWEMRNEARKIQVAKKAFRDFFHGNMCKATSLTMD